MSKKNIIIKWGLIGSIVSVIFGILAYLLNLQESRIIQFLSVLVILAAIIFSQFEYRDKLGNGFAEFGQLFKVGLLVSIIISLTSVVWGYIYIEFIDPDLISRTLLDTEIKLEEKGMSDDQIKQALDMTKKFMTPLYMAIMSFFYTAIVGLVITLISSAVIKNPKPEATIDTLDE